MVEWVLDNVASVDSAIVDLGCGNGHLLLELATEGGYKNLTGIDYSESAIALATSVALQRDMDWIHYEAVDFLNHPQWFKTPYDIVLDKGTYDAISLHPDQEKAKKEGVAGPREQYVLSVREMIKPDGLFLITSCNWTKEELIDNFKHSKNTEESYPSIYSFTHSFSILDFRYHSHVKYPVFEFGGQSGSKICTVAFQPL
jgi:SAM-dependent methyltransferase